MIVLVPDSAPHAINIKDGVPAPALKWAEESYNVVEIRESALLHGDPLTQALDELKKIDECKPSDVVGLVGERALSLDVCPLSLMIA